jgi:hypothetical protein
MFKEPVPNLGRVGYRVDGSGPTRAHLESRQCVDRADEVAVKLWTGARGGVSATPNATGVPSAASSAASHHWAIPREASYEGKRSRFRRVPGEMPRKLPT